MGRLYCRLVIVMLNVMREANVLAVIEEVYAVEGHPS
jgi:hypothetical protein